MMNGALTIGTYDGANIEILYEVGEENFFLFGLKANEVQDLQVNYDPMSYINQDLKAVMELLQSGHFNAHEPGIFDGIIQSLQIEIISTCNIHGIDKPSNINSFLLKK